MSPELQVEVKVQKPMGEEDVEEMENKRIIGRGLVDMININDEDKFEYKRLVLKLWEIDSRGDFDGVHTIVYVPYGTFLVKMPYDKFNYIYEAMTGTKLRTEADFKFETRRPSK